MIHRRIDGFLRLRSSRGVTVRVLLVMATPIHPMFLPWFEELSYAWPKHALSIELFAKPMASACARSRNWGGRQELSTQSQANTGTSRGIGTAGMEITVARVPSLAFAIASAC